MKPTSRRELIKRLIKGKTLLAIELGCKNNYLVFGTYNSVIAVGNLTIARGFVRGTYTRGSGYKFKTIISLKTGEVMK